MAEAVDEGIITSKCSVKLGTVREGLGLVAQRNIARNEFVLEVPKKFWINSGPISISEIGGVCGGLKPWIAIALFLIREKKLGNDSNWRFYVDLLLPNTDSSIYWFWISLN
ncbi:rubisco methyltransferase family protein [Actinidia rufa]|uniref:Rubisco methyltransferase family protein n=1 Tax=Actinidia rufa TaxID=165716 RepID=A0A7J0DD34_9ERIC|nr:rubisco methyltransferase family protein [Actinidia rufa]